MKRPGHFSRRGSALIMALWALLLLSAAVFAWLKFIDLNITVSGEANSGLDAKALAHSGIMAALHPAVSQQTAILKHQFTPQRGYQVQMTGEGGKLNLNWLFSPSEQPDPAKIAIFQRYCAGRGLNFQQSIHLTDCILDWLSPPGVPRLNGAEDSADYHPPHRGFFVSVQELSLIQGSQPLVSQPGWEDDFTVYTNPGLVDLQAAPERVLQALPNVGGVNADRFVKMRRGPDGLDGTADDHFFKSVTEAMSFLGASGAQGQALCIYVTLENPLVTQQPTVHLLSTGTSGKTVRRVEVVAKKMGMQPIILSWKEL